MLRSENILKTIVTSLTVNKDQKKNVAPIRNCHWLKNVFLKYYLTLSFFALLIQALRHNMMHDLRDYCLWSGLYPLLALSLPLLDNCLCLTIAFAWQLLLLDNCFCLTMAFVFRTTKLRAFVVAGVNSCSLLGESSQFFLFIHFQLRCLGVGCGLTYFKPSNYRIHWHWFSQQSWKLGFLLHIAWLHCRRRNNLSSYQFEIFCCCGASIAIPVLPLTVVLLWMTVISYDDWILLHVFSTTCANTSNVQFLYRLRKMW